MSNIPGKKVLPVFLFKVKNQLKIEKISPAIFYGLLNNRSTKQAFWIGQSYGFGLWTVGGFWLYTSIHVYGDTPMPLVDNTLYLALVRGFVEDGQSAEVDVAGTLGVIPCCSAWNCRRMISPTLAQSHFVGLRVIVSGAALIL